MSGRCVVEAISGGKISPVFQVEKKDPVVSASEKIAGHQRSPGLARGGEIDCFRSFGDEPDERSGSGAIFFFDA